MPVNRLAIASLLLTLAAGTSCRAFWNYQSPFGPRYGADLRGVSTAYADSLPPVLRIVTYNLQYGRDIDGAIALLQSPALRDADIITLQEMDDSGSHRIAEALGMAYVYYPAGVHPKTERELGNAVLARWPIVADAKLLLPHVGRIRGAVRIATAATVRIGPVDVRVYSTHLGTQTEIGSSKRRDQVRAILHDAAPYAVAIIAGDMNSYGIGALLRDAGFDWRTEHHPATTWLFNWDHIFTRGFDPDAAPSGVVRDTAGTSDHVPVWASATFVRPTHRAR